MYLHEIDDIMTKKVDIIDLSYQHPIIFFDGVCHLCDGTVQRLMKMDKTGILRFATLQYARENDMLNTNVDSVILLHHGQLYFKSNAAIKILSILGGKYNWAARLFKIFPKVLRDLVYDFIAKYRYRWFGRYDTCIIPDTHQKARFLG